MVQHVTACCRILQQSCNKVQPFSAAQVQSWLAAAAAAAQKKSAAATAAQKSASAAHKVQALHFYDDHETRFVKVQEFYILAQMFDSCA